MFLSPCRVFHESPRRPNGGGIEGGRTPEHLTLPGVAAAGWDDTTRRSSTISDISDINLEVDTSGFEVRMRLIRHTGFERGKGNAA